MANYNINFENNFNRLVMKITPINFLYRQNVQIRRLIKVDYKRSLWAVVVPTLITLIFFNKQPGYKQLALRWQIAKQHSGLNLFSLRTIKTID